MITQTAIFTDSDGKQWTAVIVKVHGPDCVDLAYNPEQGKDNGKAPKLSSPITVTSVPRKSKKTTKYCFEPI